MCFQVLFTKQKVHNHCQNAAVLELLEMAVDSVVAVEAKHDNNNIVSMGTSRENEQVIMTLSCLKPTANFEVEVEIEEFGARRE